MISALIALGLAVYLHAAVHWIIRPLLLDLSLYGAAAVIAMAAAFYVLLPPGQRRTWSVYAIITLALQRIFSSLPALDKISELLALLIGLIVLAVVARIWGRVPLRHYLLSLAVALVFSAAQANEFMPYWTEFRVLWQSPPLASTRVPASFFPMLITDVDEDGNPDILTLREKASEPSDSSEQPYGEPERQVVPIELGTYPLEWVAFSWENGQPHAFAPRQIPAEGRSLYLNFPYWVTIQEEADGDHNVTLRPQVDRLQLIEQDLRLTQVPWSSLQLAAMTLQQNRSRTTGDREPHQSAQPDGQILGRFRSADGSPIVLIRNEHLVFARQGVSAPTETIQTITARDLAPYGVKLTDFYTADALVADLDSDGLDDLLLNTQPAMVWLQKEDGRFEPAWVSPRTSFRFETAAVIGGETQWIVNAPSWVRNVPTRYLTGMIWQDGRFVQKWRIFPTSLINVRAADLNGDGSQEIIAQRYGEHRIMVLQKHGLPVIPAMYLVSLAGLILLAWRRSRHNTMLSSLLLLAIGMTATGCSLTSAPLHSGASSQPDATQRYFTPGLAEETEMSGQEVRNWLLRAQAAGQEVERFRFTGWVANYTGKNQLNNMFDGFQVLPDQAAVDLRLAAQPYRYNQRKEKAHYYDQAEWHPVQGVSDLHPFQDLQVLLPYSDQATRLHDEAVLGEPCIVIRFVLRHEDLQQLLERLEQPDATAAMLPPGSETAVVLWISLEDGTLRQLRSFSRIPTPEAGPIIQESYVRFWQFEDPTLEVLDPLEQ